MAKIKNPFKKQSIIDTAVSVGVGGAANVAMDYVFGMIPKETLDLSATTKNAIKIAVGVLGGTMTSNKYLRAAVDGIAVVGVSDIVAGYVSPTSGLPEGTVSGAPIGRVRSGNRFYRSGRKVSGVSEALAC